MRKADIASGLFLMALGAIAAVATLDMPYWSDVSPGPAFAARWVALIAGLLGGIIVFQALTGPDVYVIEWPGHAGARNVVVTCALLLAFAVALPWVGFATSAALFMMAMLVAVQQRPWGMSLLATAITVGGSYGIFVKWLQIKLPLGPFGI